MSPSDLVVEEISPAVEGRRVLLCVGGGIAAYKACELARLLMRAGAHVDVAMTEAAQRFVSALTFQALVQRPVATTLLDASEEQQIGHIGLADRAEVAVVAPLTADLAMKLRMGAADDIVTTALLATRAPILLAPSMNVHMWNHPATRDNLEVLQARGCHQVGPGSGDMACGHVGDGRLAEPWDIARAVARLLAPQDLAGRRVVVTAGPTREPMDPVRFISNPSSGKMGFALAAALQLRGARVTLVAGPCALATPPGVTRVDIQTAEQMSQALSDLDDVDAVCMAAAVSDWRPEITHGHKVKKSAEPETLTFVRTPDILAGLGERFEGRARRPLLVGFAAETQNVAEYAREKLVRKKVDLVVANDVSPGGAFGNDTNEVLLVSRDGETVVPRASKGRVAWAIVDEMVRRLS